VPQCVLPAAVRAAPGWLAGTAAQWHSGGEGLSGRLAQSSYLGLSWLLTGSHGQPLCASSAPSALAAVVGRPLHGSPAGQGMQPVRSVQHPSLFPLKTVHPTLLPCSPEGTYSGEGAKACIACPVGQVRLPDSACHAAPPTTVRTESHAAGAEAQAGTF